MWFFNRQKPVRMPKALRQREIQDMEVGETGYAVHWALQMDEDGRAWLWDSHNIHKEPCGTASMRVSRTNQGYHVKITDAEFTWSPSYNKNATIPVVGLKMADGSRI